MEREHIYKFIKKSPNGCWYWQRGHNDRGYGVCYVSVDGKLRMSYAHRVSYEVAVGPIPDGLYVCHRCDNPSCINPEHLFAGTGKDNMQDCKRKGRMSMPPRHAVNWTVRFPERIKRGEKSPNATMKDADARAVIMALAEGHTPHSIAIILNITESAIADIARRRTFKHIAATFPGDTFDAIKRHAQARRVKGLAVRWHRGYTNRFGV